MQKADFYKELSDRRVLCTLCPHNCRLSDGEFGVCGVRQNQNGVLYTHVYERAVATHVDPIEKKPLFHVYPGSRSFSISTVGCNFKCSFCQNHEISQMPQTGSIEGKNLPVAQVIQMAAQAGCKTIACTYTEPTIYFEYACDIAVNAAEQGIKTVFVSNGFINAKPMEKIAPFLVAANIDLKGWDEKFYRDVCGGELKSVLNTLMLMKKLGIFIEVTTLLVTGYVDNEKTLREIVAFILNELGPETPWHISRFYPNFQYQHVPPTSIDMIKRARDIGLEAGLRYVYSGNVPGDDGESTWCYSCGAKLISRYGYQIEYNNIKDHKCPGCAAAIDGIGLG